MNKRKANSMKPTEEQVKKLQAFTNIVLLVALGTHNEDDWEDLVKLGAEYGMIVSNERVTGGVMTEFAEWILTENVDDQIMT